MPLQELRHRKPRHAQCGLRGTRVGERGLLRGFVLGRRGRRRIHDPLPARAQREHRIELGIGVEKTAQHAHTLRALAREQ